MGSENLDPQQKKIREFMTLLPLTIEVAGLPRCDMGKHFNEDQMAARATTIRLAYKTARQILLDVVK